MNKTLKLAAFLLGLALCASGAFGQTILPMTTLSSAVTLPTNAVSSSVTLTSITGIVAQSNTSGGTDLYVDQELMQVNYVPASGTTLSVTRGYGGTQAQAHLKSAIVFVISPTAQPYAIVTTVPQGACTRGASATTSGQYNTQSTLYLPIIDTRDMVFADCLGGVFVAGDAWPLQVTAFRVLSPDPGAVLYTSINSTGTTLAATTMYCSEIDLPFNKYVTGLGVLLGTTGGTDKHLVVLYDAAGNLLANSATAGTTAGTASTYETLAFTTPYFAIGPAQYFGCLQTNGTTATVRMRVTSVQDNALTKGVTGQTFGTVPATITVPTTFTTAVGPYELMY